MNDLIIEKKNESFLILSGEQSTLQEIQDAFAFYAEGYKFHPKVKAKLWDGIIRIFRFTSKNKGEIYCGLLPEIINFCKSRNYTYTILDNVFNKEKVDVEEIKSFIKNLNLSSKKELIDPRDYQIKGFVDAINNKRILLLSPTSSGKSLIIYLICKYLIESGKRGLILVPNISLVHQLYSDFEDYSALIDWKMSKNSQKIYQGQSKVITSPITLSTWQSIYDIKDEEFFEQFDFVLNDEVHTAKATSLTGILEKCTNAEYRIGLTGTLDNLKVNEKTLIGLFGPITKVITTKELMDRKQVSELKIKCLILKYDKEISKAIKKFKYQEEIKFLVSNNKRNIFIKNLALSMEKNTIILFNYVETHGKVIYELLKNSKLAKGRNIYFIHGGVEGEEREKIRNIMEHESNAIIVASSGTMSTGVSIKNLHNIIFAISGKSRIRNLQSIGRVLRLHESKDAATLYDIVDDLSVGKHQNFTLGHFLERVKTYNQEHFEYKIITVPFEAE
jgi:superfamily II DNA or RNA helicase